MTYISLFMALSNPLKDFFKSSKRRKISRLYEKECEEAERMIERKIVSMELHDNILSRIFGLRMLMGYIKISDDKVVQEKYVTYLGDLYQIEKEIRELSRGLSSRLLATEIHFPDDLKKLIARQAEIGDTIEIIYTDNVDWEEVEEIVKWNIYRVLQQLFNNIHRHAEASLVCVKLYTDESNQLILSLIEDGIGFELDKEFETANGLNNIQLRVDSCGGNIDIKSNINSGTEIFISLPKSIKKENYDKQVFGPNH